MVSGQRFLNKLLCERPSSALVQPDALLDAGDTSDGPPVGVFAEPPVVDWLPLRWAKVELSRPAAVQVLAVLSREDEKAMLPGCVVLAAHRAIGMTAGRRMADKRTLLLMV
jgi:hypothetical protein